MKKNKYALLSIILSGICIIGLLIFNYNLAQVYLSSDGKTQALFGINEFMRLYIKFYFIPFVIGSLIFTIRSFQKKEIKSLKYASVICFLIVVATFFIRFWRFMI